MALTIADLVAAPPLRTRIVAGERGADRVVRWAHVCELSDAGEWLGEGDLLLTTGMGIPPGETAQRNYVGGLCDAGLSGLAIGESGTVAGASMMGPPLTAALFEEAERLCFPVMITAHSVPFVAVAHTVFDAAMKGEHDRLSQLLALYEGLRLAAIESLSPAETVARLGRESGFQIVVVDQQSNRPLLSARGDVPEEWLVALRRRLAALEGPPPAGLRLSLGSSLAMVVPVPASRAALMVAVPIGSRRLDLVLLQHVATIVALELERLISDQERRRRIGTELFLRLRSGAMEHRAARSELTALGVPTGELIVMASSNVAGGADLHFRLAAHGLGHLLTEDDGAVYALIADDPEALVAAEAELRRDHLGISAPFAYLPETSQAFRQARLALQSAQREATHVVRYTDETAFPPFYPQDVRDAERAVINILGPLIKYDDAHQSHLVETLHLFLTNNRSWQPTATALHIHKQTLVYRIRRIEQVTGRHLSSTADVAQLWLALEADGLLGERG